MLANIDQHFIINLFTNPFTLRDGATGCASSVRTELWIVDPSVAHPEEARRGCLEACPERVEGGERNLHFETARKDRASSVRTEG